MLISVIIPTYNRVQGLKYILELFLTQKKQSWWNYELIIVDNNSTDSTGQYLEELTHKDQRVKSLVELKQGTGFALNKGITSAQGEIIVVSADDVVIQEDRLMIIAEIFKNNPDVQCATGKVLPLWNGLKPPQWYSDQVKGVLVHVDYGNQRKVVNYCVGTNTCFRKTVFERFGLFDTAWRFEDVHFARRIREAIKIHYFPQMFVYHPVHPERLTKSYFKRWYALAGAFEGNDVQVSGRNIFHVELWRYKKAFTQMIQYGRSLFDTPQRFYHQCELIFFMSLFLQRNGRFKA